MEYGEDASHASTFDSDVTPEHELELSTNQVLLAQSPRLENFGTTRDAMETDMHELAELSLRAYRVMKVASVPSTDELQEMAQSTLKVLARILTVVRHQQNGASVTSNQRSDSPSSIYDSRQTSISLVLQAISVCEQIYNSFVHVCSALRSELEPQSKPGIDSNRSENDPRTSDAQAVMTVELINYLFEKLSRSHRQLLSIELTAIEPSPSSSSSIVQHDSSPDGASMTSGVTVPLTSTCGSPTTLIPVMIQRAQGKHTQLRAHIQTIRDLTRQKDNIE
uniref:Aflatoxin regulatory protein domain-containing protein n=1 Tax=Bionectria ochroleuca TaxID=29856 RepID=A0A8H7K3A5_BIOOC